MQQYIPRSKLLVRRTNHLTEVRMDSNRDDDELKRQFDWLSDETIATAVHKFIHKMEKHDPYVFHCWYKDVPVYILGAFDYYHGNPCFTVISTLKSDNVYMPFSEVNAFHRFSYSTDLSEVKEYGSHAHKIEAAIRKHRAEKLSKMPPKAAVAFAMKNLRNRIKYNNS